MPNLLVVDDEQSICWGLSKLGRTMGHTVAVAASAEEGFALALQQRPDAIVLDVRLPGMDGLSALEQFHADLGLVPIIIMTAYGELSTAVAAVRSGAFDYLVKPFDLQVAERVIQRAIEMPGRSCQARSLPCPESGEEIVGISVPMQEVFKRIALVAPSDACVHLRGESGTGKEFVARAIHRYSRRAQGPFVPVNIAALAPSLAESELFGHVRGAFTGADQSHKGLLEQAHGGTIFLDEVADIPQAVQVKLLRALEYGEVQPVGSERSVSADFRVISATHQNLCQQVAEGAFRHDLYFRLVTFEIAIPPLRERREDIAPLVEYFLEKTVAKGQSLRPTLSSEAMAELERRPWHGNARELRNAVEHATIMARSGSIAREHLPPPTSLPMSPGDSPEEQIAALIQRWTELQLTDRIEVSDLYTRLLELVERPVLQVVMCQNHGQCASAARQLGLHRITLRKKLEHFGITDGW